MRLLSPHTLLVLLLCLLTPLFGKAQRYDFDDLYFNSKDEQIRQEAEQRTNELRQLEQQYQSQYTQGNYAITERPYDTIIVPRDQIYDWNDYYYRTQPAWYMNYTWGYPYAGWSVGWGWGYPNYGWGWGNWGYSPWYGGGWYYPYYHDHHHRRHYNYGVRNRYRSSYSGSRNYNSGSKADYHRSNKQRNYSQPRNRRSNQGSYRPANRPPQQSSPSYRPSNGGNRSNFNRGGGNRGGGGGGSRGTRVRPR